MLSPVPTAHRDLVGVSSLLVGHGFRFGFILGRRAINGLSSKKREMDKGRWRLDAAGVGNVGCGGGTFFLARSVGGWVIFPFFKRWVKTHLHW